MKLLIDMNLSPEWVETLGPSVIQVRTQDIMPQSLGDRMAQVLREHEAMLEKGALVTVDETKSRVRILPL